MKVSIIQNCSYAPDKVNEKKLIAGEVCELPDRIANAFIGHGYCKPFKDSPKKVYTPVEETAVVEPVEEVKTKRRRKRSKKAE